MKISRRKKGFTLAEVLIAVAILAIFCSMAAVGTTALFGTGEKISAVSKAAVLGSDVMEVLTNEVRFGEEFDVKDGKLTYNSSTYGDHCTVTIGSGTYEVYDSSGNTVQKELNKQLVIMQGAKGTSQKSFVPIGTAAYGDNVFINSLNFTVEKDKSVTITVSITSNDGGDLWNHSATIVPLYLKVAS